LVPIDYFHNYQRLQKAFNGSTEEEKAPKALNIEHISTREKLSTRYEKVK